MSERFTDHEDGTITDNQTGLMWTKDAGTIRRREFETKSTKRNQSLSEMLQPEIFPYHAYHEKGKNHSHEPAERDDGRPEYGVLGWVSLRDLRIYR